jgi:hypothetical protein
VTIALTNMISLRRRGPVGSEPSVQPRLLGAALDLVGKQALDLVGKQGFDSTAVPHMAERAPLTTSTYGRIKWRTTVR